MAGAVGVASELLPGVVERASEALGDPARFVRFLEEYGGVPPVLYTIEELVSSLSGTE